MFWVREGCCADGSHQKGERPRLPSGVFQVPHMQQAARDGRGIFPHGEPAACVQERLRNGQIQR